MKHHHIIIYALLALVLVVGMTSCRHGRDDAMLGRLDYVSRCNRADTVFTERWLPTVDSLVSYFNRHGSANERMMAHYVAGRVHYDIGEAPQALECYQKAADQADTTRSDCDLYTLYAVYGQMADLFHAQYLPDDEMQALKMAERVALKSNDTLSAIRAYELLSRPYFLKDDTDSVLHIERNVRERYLCLGDTVNAAIAIRASFSLLIDRCEYDRARQLMTIYEKQSGLFDSLGNIKQGRELYYYDKGRCLLATDHSDSSRICFEKTLQAGYKEAGYKGLLTYYEKKHVADSITKYANLFVKANDQSYLHNNQEVVHQTSSLYNYTRQQRLAEKRLAEIKESRYYIIILLLTVVLLLYVGIRGYKVYHQYKREKNLQLLQLQANYNQSEMQIQSYKQQLTIINARNMEDKLAESVIVQTMRAKANPIKGTKPPTTADWKQLTDNVALFMPDYYHFLTHHHLSTQELRTCILLRLNFSTSEIANLLETSSERISKVKLLIIGKLNANVSTRALTYWLKNL